jgi:hypothetical protein
MHLLIDSAIAKQHLRTRKADVLLMSIEEKTRKEVDQRIRRKTIVLESDPDQRLYMLTVEFEADYENGEISIGDEDILEAKWFAEPPEAVHDFIEGKVEEWDNG